ncbi:MAG: peptidase [Thaumarchaeota archaeon 13_1_40CM_38_12]|nr:MAG: peptidase [Thaumarchaeota archaeon 13_1_40CM_38_12]OLC34688.1 MAG: peptidase [Thaumarchaeota archaeon 13_1_40CM_4_38_7]OLC91524.1 MAG: peptidase [Thaumarchaeota archaeon 13_1_40CM_3_38_6]OLD27662.1 MAG: peptidase [Thaumarchaeota archaeon 13_1_40CM_2_39_7]TLY05456.1 MAG: peptidase [Nitrososphaerota archaeon]
MIFKKRERPHRTITIIEEVRDGILSYCKMNHPNEGILVLRGKAKKDHILIDGLVIPPFSHSGPTFAGFPHSFLPFDPSYVGTVHSHPNGVAKPSVTDLHNFFGFVSIIVQSPYEDDDIFAYDRDGNLLELTISLDKS